MIKCLNCLVKETKAKSGLCQTCSLKKKVLVNKILSLGEKYIFLSIPLNITNYSILGLTEQLNQLNRIVTNHKRMMKMVR